MERKKIRKKKSSIASPSKDEKIEILEDELYKFDPKEAKQKSKIFRFSPKKKNKKSYDTLELEPLPMEKDVKPVELLPQNSTRDSGRRNELTRSSTYDGPSRRPPASVLGIKNTKKTTLPLPKRLSFRKEFEIERNSTPSIELSQ